MGAKKTAAALGFVLLALSGTSFGQESYIVRPDVTDWAHVRDDASPDNLRATPTHASRMEFAIAAVK